MLGEVRWPHDKLFADTPIGGLSSIDYDASSGLYYLVSDDRSTHAPARFYTARIDYDAAGLHQVSLQNAMPLLSPAQQPYPSDRKPEAGIATPDAEALRLLPGGKTMLWSSEGDFARGFGPQLLQASIDGRWQRDGRCRQSCVCPHHQHKDKAQASATT
ncbi:MAG: esterase-like activity of phytase family protein [Comamonas sp.]